MDEELYKDFDGLPLLDLYNQESLRSAKNYKPRRGDIILVSYPKSGSNWTHFIIWNIMTRGQQPKDIMELGLRSPFLEVTGAEVAEDSCRTGPIATHFPYKVFPPVDQAKYVYVARNPYDCAVSMHHFLKGLTPKTYMDVSFDKFLRLFLSGKAFYGDYFDHVLPWYEHRHQPNILFITYEQLQADAKGMVLKIALFLVRNMLPLVGMILLFRKY
nr:sulfotransferase 2B1-like [Rhipicephalus microplus]